MIQLETAAGAAIKNFTGAVGQYHSLSGSPSALLFSLPPPSSSFLLPSSPSLPPSHPLSFLTLSPSFSLTPSLSLYPPLLSPIPPLLPGINVPRSRFLPVKKTSDLLVVMSNLFTLQQGTLRMNPQRSYPSLPLVKLGDQHFMNVCVCVRACVRACVCARVCACGGGGLL